MKIIAGYSSVNLTHAVCKMLDTKPVLPTYKRFSDGEISVDIAQKDIQDDACLLIHSLSEPVNDTMIALLLTIDALKQSGAKKIVGCLPYLAYTRQTAASLITSLMHAAGAQKCITIDPHITIRNAIIPIDALSTAQLFADHIKATHNLQNLVIVAPDQGGVERCKHVRDALELTSSLACIDKIRLDGLCTVQAVHGDVLGKRCVIVDDIIDTGTTLYGAAEALMKHGAAEVFAYCTHGVLSETALDRVQQSVIKKLVITDSITQLQNALKSRKIETISVTHLIAQQVKLYLIQNNP